MVTVEQQTIKGSVFQYSIWRFKTSKSTYFTENKNKEKERKLIIPCYQWKTDIGRTLLLMVFL